MELALADEIDDEKQFKYSPAAVTDDAAERNSYLMDLCEYSDFQALVAVVHGQTVIVFHCLI